MDKLKPWPQKWVGASSFLAASGQGLGRAQVNLKALLAEMEPSDLCLVNRNNEQLFSTYSEKENDLFHLIGFSGSSGILIVRRAEVLLLVDRRYLEVSHRQYEGTLVSVQEREGRDWVNNVLLPWSERYRGRGGARCFIDKSRWAASEIRDLQERLGLVCWEHRAFGGQSPKVHMTPLSWCHHDFDISNLQKIQRCIKSDEIHLFTCPDDIAWLMEARSDDFDFRRSVKAIAFVSKSEAILFCNITAEAMDDFGPRKKEWTLVPDRQAWSMGMNSMLKKSPQSRCVVSFHSRPGGVNEEDFERVQERFPEHKIEKTARSLAELGRLEKNSWELDKMTLAQKKCADLMAQVIDYIQHEIAAGRELRETQVLERTDGIAHQLGAIRPCFPGIVASGEHSRFPHHTPTRRLIKKGEPVLLDLGYYFDEGFYATDMSRTIWSDLVSRPHPKVVEVYTAVLKAFLKQWSFCTQQVDFRADRIDDLGRSILDVWRKEGYAFIHSTGHGVGISDHELGITIGPNSNLTLRPGYVYSLEPGLYRENPSTTMALNFGVRLEDVVTVQEDSSFCRHRSLGPACLENRLIDRRSMDDLENFQLETYLRLV